MAHQNSDYDLVITGGSVIDPETGLDAVRNVGINVRMGPPGEFMRFGKTDDSHQQ